MENMHFYNMCREVPKEAQKPIKAGRIKGMTDINPMWRIKKLTEMFGACGVGWWYDITDKHIVFDELTKQKAAFVDILLYYVDPESGHVSHGIPGTGGSSFVSQEKSGLYLSDECYKMALTDAISVAAKALGVGANIYFAADRTKYTNEPEEAPQPKQPVQEALMECEVCGDVLEAYEGKSGKRITVAHHARVTKERYGRVLCIKCVNALKEQEVADDVRADREAE